MNTVELILQRPKTPFYRLFLSATSTVERVNLPDGGVALRVDSVLYELLPAIKASGLTPAQHEATAQAALTDVKEAIRLAQECKQLAHYLDAPWEESSAEEVIRPEVRAELVYQYWRIIFSAPTALLIDEQLDPDRLGELEQVLNEPFGRRRPPSIEEATIIARLLGLRLIRDAILDNTDEDASLWDIALPAVLYATTRQELVKAQALVDTIGQHYDRTPRSQLPLWARWDLSVIASNLDAARDALRRGIYAVTMNVAKWEQQELEQIKIQCEEHEAPSKE